MGSCICVLGVSSQESEGSCICVLGVVYLCVGGRVFVCLGLCICVLGVVYLCVRGRVFEILQQCGIFCFSFYYDHTKQQFSELLCNSYYKE